MCWAVSLDDGMYPDGTRQITFQYHLVGVNVRGIVPQKADSFLPDLSTSLNLLLL